MPEPTPRSSRVGTSGTTRSFPWGLLWLVILLGSALAAARWAGIGDHVEATRLWIESLGTWGPAAYVGIYVVAVVAAVPGSVVTAAAGALFGSLVGVVVVSLGSTLGASLSFLIARYVARGSIEAWLADNERFQRLDSLTETHGAVIVALTRLVPLFPFSLLNYGFGLTRIRFGTYLLWSWICMLPGTVLYVVGADALTRGVADGKMPWGLIVIVVLALLLVIGLANLARRRLLGPSSRRSPVEG